MSTTTSPFSAEQLLRIPDDNFRYELIEGVLITMSPSGFEHGNVAATVAAMLWQHVKTHKLGRVLGAETGFKLTTDPDTVLAPDASFIRQEEFDRIGMTKKFWPGAPDLAAEVMSPDDSVRKTEEKARMWLDHGARMVWVINPKRRTVSVFRPNAETVVLSEGDVLAGQDVVPGFSCRVDEIFA